MFYVVKEDGLKSIRYPELSNSVIDHHLASGELLAWLERPITDLATKPEEIYVEPVTEDGDVIVEGYYYTPSHTPDYGQPTLAEVQAGSEAVVDYFAGETREYFVSKGQMIQEEYRLARDEARAWVDAGKPADAVPESMQVWMDVTGQTADVVAQEIEQTAQTWEGLLNAVRTIRLTAKGVIRNATDEATVKAAVKTAHDSLAALKV